MLSLLLFLAMLTGKDAQNCTIEMALSAIEERLKDSEIRFQINFTDTNPNCLATSDIRGSYQSISMSVKFYRDGDNSTINEVRSNYICLDNYWLCFYEEESYFNGTRSDCSDCSNTTVNDHHCQR